MSLCMEEMLASIPGFKAIRSLDPIHVKRISVQQAGHDLISLNLDIQNADLYGLSTTTFEDAGSDLSKLYFKYKVKVPSFKLVGDYDVKGNVLNLALDGKGKIEILIKNGFANFEAQLKTRKDGDHVFAVLEKISMDLEDAQNVHITLANIFNGDKTLEDSFHTLINDNWKSLFAVVRPSINQAVQIVLKAYMGKVMEYVPISLVFVE
ncbi:protein takeout-like [Haematobia irritans]|uniref:protein takeout-like n=1 Tax=Haematobia irritans TaxID=7368 RepID=UPI003F4F8FC3